MFDYMLSWASLQSLSALTSGQWRIWNKKTHKLFENINLRSSSHPVPTFSHLLVQKMDKYFLWFTWWLHIVSLKWILLNYLTNRVWERFADKSGTFQLKLVHKLSICYIKHIKEHVYWIVRIWFSGMCDPMFWWQRSSVVLWSCRMRQTFTCYIATFTNSSQHIQEHKQSFQFAKNGKERKIVSFFDIAQKKRVAILGFSFWLKCENEGIMKVFWCMPSTVMSSSILLQAFTKRCANSKWVTFSLKLKSFKSILSPQILLTWPWNWTWHVL